MLRELSSQVQAILHADPDSKAIRTDWRQRVKMVRPIVAEEQANLNGITRPDIARALMEGYQGGQVGVYREGDLILPIIMRAEEANRSRIESLYNLQIWSPAAGAMIPLRQVVSDFETVNEDEIIMRRNRKPTITVFADPIADPATVLFARVRPQIEAIELPTGYELEWGGEYEDSGNAQAGLAASIPMFVLVMILITIMLFNSLRQPLIIWLVVPLAVIGVSGGDKDLLSAIVDSGVSRLRPVAMAASTTALGMIPLLFDAFFVAMAITIIAGLMFATLLTMIVVPVLYATFYKAESAS